MNPSLKRFLDSLGDVAPTSDSYDTTLLADLAALEREAAENALIDVARRRGDARAVVTIGKLGLTRAIPVLRLLMAHPTAWVRFSVHRALTKLGAADGLQPLIDDALVGSVVERFGAIVELAQVPGEAALNALLRGLEDPDALVRGRAMDSLAVRFEVDDLRRDVHGSVLVESPLKTLEALLLSELAPVWQHAAWQARTTFQALAAGVSPEALCLRYVPTAPAGFRERVASAFFHDEQPFDVAPIKATYGADRRWAESFLVLQLDPAVRSARAVGAIADLAADWLRPALEASAAGLTEDNGYVHAVDAALTRLAA